MIRSAFAVAAITFLSRITGLLREMTNAHFLGTGLAADAFGIAFLIPNVFRRLVGEGAMASAFVPVFTRHVHGEDPSAVRIFAEKFFTLWTILLAAITLLGMAFAGAALLSLGALGVSWGPEKLELTASLTRWLFPYLFLIGLSAVAGAILNSFGTFALPSSTPLLYNLAFIAAGFLLAPFFPGDGAAYAFSIGILVGGALQLGILLPSLWKLGIRPRLRWPGGHEGVREVLRLLIPGTFGAGIYQINVMVSSFLAMKLADEGPVSSLRYAGRLMEVVLGVFVFALSTVSITTLSRQAAAGDRPAFRSTLSEVLRLTLFITIPSAAGLYILREPVISLLLRSGQFDENSSRLTSLAFQCYVPGIVFVGWNRILVSAFYSLKDIWTPTAVGAINLAVNFALSWTLMGPLGHAGIALASTGAALIQSLWLSWVLVRRERDIFEGRALLASSARFLISSLALAAVSWLAVRYLPWQGAGKVVLALEVLGAILAAAAVYFVVSALLGAREASTILGALARRRRTGSGG